jgi:hypothetical protein
MELESEKVRRVNKKNDGERESQPILDDVNAGI